MIPLHCFVLLLFFFSVSERVRLWSDGEGSNACMHACMLACLDGSTDGWIMKEMIDGWMMGWWTNRNGNKQKKRKKKKQRQTDALSTQFISPTSLFQNFLSLFLFFFSNRSGSWTKETKTLYFIQSKAKQSKSICFLFCFVMSRWEFHTFSFLSNVN